MCGIFGILASNRLRTSDAEIARLRDTMTHRGPDGAGLWRKDGCALAHRRLKVVDTSDAAAQPMVTPDDRYAIVYNGELYNDTELRVELSREGITFRTSSDTETVLAALIHWGPAAIHRLRGMFALGFYDSLTRRLFLARDPLGIKPLYYRFGPTRDGESILFASEPRAILEHPDVPARPDWVTVSAYLTTIRTVMGDRTLFESIRTLRPGESLEFEVRGEEISRKSFPPSPITRSSDRASSSPLPALSAPPAPLRDLLSDSIHRHLRSDVPLSCMLSGGLDSSIIAAIATDLSGPLATYCSGSEGTEDFACARLISQHLASRHTEAPISRELFQTRWPELVARMGMPLSTPNEVAINHVARQMRADGFIVALSGEGADELFAGYELPMLDAARYEGLLPRDAERDRAWFRPGILHGGDFQLAANAWTQLADKPAILAPELWRACEHDDALREFYRAEFDAASEAAPADSPLQAHLRFHRRINLAGLLSRLDTATMLEGVEGRTPLADRVICDYAEALPMHDKFTFERPRLPSDIIKTETKKTLRAAFADRLPSQIVKRPKASFPLPMEWVSDLAPALRQSRFARDTFSIAAIETVAAAPANAWPIAWPMINLALWGQHWWG